LEARIGKLQGKNSRALHLSVTNILLFISDKGMAMEENMAHWSVQYSLFFLGQNKVWIFTLDNCQMYMLSILSIIFMIKQK